MTGDSQKYSIEDIINFKNLHKFDLNVRQLNAQIEQM